MAGLQRGLIKAAKAMNQPDTYFEAGKVESVSEEPVRAGQLSNCVCGARLTNLYLCRVGGVPMVLGRTCKENLLTRNFTSEPSSGGGNGGEGGAVFDKLNMPEWLAECRILVEQEETRLAGVKKEVEAYRQTPEYKAREEMQRKVDEAVRRALSERVYAKEQERRRMGWIIDDGGLTDTMRASLNEARRQRHTRDLARRGLL